jgi:hypothetical protein
VLASPGTFLHFITISLPHYLSNTLASGITVRISDFRGVKDLENQQLVLSDEALKRLCSSYSQMIQEAPKDPKSPYYVGGLWEEWKTQHQSKLVRALINHEYSSLRRLFSNLGLEDSSLGISLSGDFAKGIFAKTLQANRLNRLLETYRGVRPSGEIQLYPENWGAFPGANMLRKDGQSGVMIPSGPRLSHNARTLSDLSLAAGALKAGTRGMGNIFEIGGGFGGIAYHLKKEVTFSGTYTNIDIPEVLIISAAFLFSEFGADEVYLYGDSADRKAASIHLLPHYRITTIPEDNASVIFNSHSLTEMNFSTIEEYLRQIERISPAFFLHHNHEHRGTYRVGEELKIHAVIGEGNLTFRDGHFQRISRNPEVLTNDGVDFGMLEYWENLYIRTHWNS